MKKVLIFIGILLLCVVAVLVRNGAVVWSFGAAMKSMKEVRTAEVRGKSNQGASTLGFMKGYALSDHYPTTNPPRFGINEKSIKIKGQLVKEHLSFERTAEELRGILPDTYNDFVTKLPDLILESYNQINVEKPVFKPESMGLNYPDFRDFKRTAHMWMDMAKLMYVEGKENSAFALCVGVLLIGHAIDRDFECSAFTEAKMYSNVVRNTANRTLAELANRSRLSAAELKDWIMKLKKIREGMNYFTDCLRTRTLFYELCARDLQKEGFYLGSVMLNDIPDFKECVEPILKPLLDADSLPYSQKKSVYSKASLATEKLASEVFNVTARKLAVFLAYPDYYLVRFIACELLSGLSLQLDGYYDSLQRADGAIAALSVKAFVAEKNRFPDSLEEVEDWIGWKLPGDIFADMAPMQFNMRSHKMLFSVGPDQKAYTDDDIVFMPVIAR